MSVIERKQTGFSLIEVMIAFFILAIGILGLTSLLTNSVKGNQGAYLRTQAIVAAQDMADRVRANKSDNYLGAASQNTKCIDNAGSCTANEMASHDLFEWNQALAATLPLGQGVVCSDDAPNDGASASNDGCEVNATLYAVKVWWDDNRDGQVNAADPRVVLSVAR